MIKLHCEYKGCDKEIHGVFNFDANMGSGSYIVSINKYLCKEHAELYIERIKEIDV